MARMYTDYSWRGRVADLAERSRDEKLALISPVNEAISYGDILSTHSLTVDNG